MNGVNKLFEGLLVNLTYNNTLLYFHRISLPLHELTQPIACIAVSFEPPVLETDVPSIQQQDQEQDS